MKPAEMTSADLRAELAYRQRLALDAPAEEPEHRRRARADGIAAIKSELRRRERYTAR